MSDTHNTLFLRLAGPMQSWGTSSRFQLRRTDLYPSKSGVLGLLLCAKGVGREESRQALDPLNRLRMAVRVDRPGTTDWDYHTVGAKIGIRMAKGGVKRTGNTKDSPIETLLSRRQYLYDASFLVGLHARDGAEDTIASCAAALSEPVWPVFLGRKCCVPAEPVCAGTGSFENLTEALASVPWRPRIDALDRADREATRALDTYIEHPPGSPPPAGARLVHDMPRRFGYYSHGARWVVPGRVTVPVGKATHQPAAGAEARVDPYGPAYQAARPIRLQRDKHLCVFCKAPAVHVHHLDYKDVRVGTLRSLCELCHDACTMLEYGRDMRTRRIDPEDPEQRPAILQQIRRLLTERRLGRRRKLLEKVRVLRADFLDDLPASWVKEGR